MGAHEGGHRVESLSILPILHHSILKLSETTNEVDENTGTPNSAEEVIDTLGDDAKPLKRQKN